MSKVIVLGINGSIGWHVARAFAQAGHAVFGLGRSNRRPQAGVQFIRGDAGNASELRPALLGADIVFNALNLPYDKWDKGRAEAQLATVIDAMPQGKTLLQPGNVYNYAATDRQITPEMKQVPQTERGAIRVRQEQVLQAAADAGHFQTIILRAGDFFGPDVEGGWMVQGMLMNIARRKVYHMGELDRAHAWAYLPDLARAFVALAEKRADLALFENFHFAGHFVTNRQMVTAAQAASSAQLDVRPFPWWMFQALGLASGVMRELVKMRYLWDNEMELVDPRLAAMLGQEFGTRLEDAVRASMEDMKLVKQAA